MQSRIVQNSYSQNAHRERPDNQVWERAPAFIVALPIPDGVPFGAEGQGPTERVGFFLESRDARGVGVQLLKAAKEAENATS